MQFKLTEEILNLLDFSKINEKSYKTIIKYEKTGQEYGFIELIDMGSYWDLTIKTLDGGCAKSIHSLFDLSDCIKFMSVGNGSGFDFNKIDES